MSASAALPSLFPHLSLAPTTRSTLEVHVFSPAGVDGGRGGDSPADDDDTAWWAALAGVASGSGDGAGGVGGGAGGSGRARFHRLAEGTHTHLSR